MPSTHLMTLPTSRCNLRCSHCVRGHPTRFDDMDPDLWARILEEGKMLGFSSVGFTGGEPCLHPHFDELLDMTVKKGYTFSITTNGIISEPYARAFRKYGSQTFEFLKVSLDGLEQEHTAMRGEGNFRKTVSSLSFYKSLDIRFVVALCVSKLNMDCLENFITYCHRQDWRNIEINILITTPANRSIVLNSGEIERVRKTIEKTERKLDIKINKSNLDKLRSSCGIIFCSELANPSITVNAMGECIFCCATIENGAVVAPLSSTSLADAYRKTLEMSYRIISMRIHDLETQKTTLNFNSCDFCNRVLQEHIRPAGR
ncbi:MAG: radical SAM protein [Candidatus Xenobiia bacterium LiM19]